MRMEEKFGVVTGAASGLGREIAKLAAAESGARAELGIAEMHRWNPLVHIANLDVACYDRPYAPVEERSAAKAAHLAAWPDAVDAAVESLDIVPAKLSNSAAITTLNLFAQLIMLQLDAGERG